MISLFLPPLKERKDDILLLADAFLERIAKERNDEIKRLSDDATEAILGYDWPGNVRELENALEHAAVLSPGKELDTSVLPSRVLEPKAQPLVGEREPVNPTLEVIERAYISWVLDSEGGNKSRAAEVLGIDPSTLYRKLTRYESSTGE